MYSILSIKKAESYKNLRFYCSKLEMIGPDGAVYMLR